MCLWSSCGRHRPCTWTVSISSLWLSLSSDESSASHSYVIASVSIVFFIRCSPNVICTQEFCLAFISRPLLSVVLIMASGIETTLDKLPMGNASIYKVPLKSLYIATKPVKNFHKAQGRLVDKKGNSIWFEITGANPQDVLNKSRQVMPGKVNVFKNFSVKTSQWHSGGLVLDFNSRSNVSLTSMAQSHPDCT